MLPLRRQPGDHIRDLCRRHRPAGDVAAQYLPHYERRVRVEHHDTAARHGRAAGRAMLGRREPFADAHWFWSDQFDANIQYAGFHAAWDRIVVRGSLESRKFLAFYLTGGRVESVVAINQGRDMRRTFPIIKARAVVDPASLADPNVDLRTLAPATA